MYIFECKECGGRNEVKNGSIYTTCAYCGKQITLPTIQDEERARLFNRANHFRRQGEFDKAISAFTGIVNQNGNDPEATWGLVLAKYGIEYVEDPRSGERIPTCNRVSNNSILTDSDYLATLDHSKDEYTRSLYVKEAERIDRIQKGILAIAKMEEPFDVFICYKETTGGGSRTEDSVLAQDIYDGLAKEGLRVFFSRITLEEKLGQQYEPYIFAALNSSKVMLVVAMDAANVNSVWVKNEWSRFLTLMRSNSSKVLIPCYKKMSVYDLPEELNIYQSQDMGKIGAMQDLIRGVKKICSKVSKQASFHKPNQENTAAMLERGFICLRDADFNKADQLFEQVLNLNPHEANAYLGKLMVERNVCVDENLRKQTRLLQRSTNYQHAMEYGDSEMKNRLFSYAEEVFYTVKKRLEESLQDAKNKLQIKMDDAIPKIQVQIQQLENNKRNNQRKLERNNNELSVEIEKLNKITSFFNAVRIVIVLSVISFCIFCNIENIQRSDWMKWYGIACIVGWVIGGFLWYNLSIKVQDIKGHVEDKKTFIGKRNNDLQSEINKIDDNIGSHEREIERIRRNTEIAINQVTEMIGQVHDAKYEDIVEIEDKANRMRMNI